MAVNGRESRKQAGASQPGHANGDPLEQWVGQRVSVCEGGVYGELLVPAHYEGFVTGVLHSKSGAAPLEMVLRVRFDNGKQAAIRADVLELAPIAHPKGQHVNGNGRTKP